jgi:hypothetical protein
MEDDTRLQDHHLPMLVLADALKRKPMRMPVPVLHQRRIRRPQLGRLGRGTLLQATRRRFQTLLMGKVPRAEEVEEKGDEEGGEGDGRRGRFEREVSDAFVVEHDEPMEEEVDKGGGDDDALQRTR